MWPPPLSNPRMPDTLTLLREAYCPPLQASFSVFSLLSLRLPEASYTASALSVRALNVSSLLLAYQVELLEDMSNYLEKGSPSSTLWKEIVTVNDLVLRNARQAVQACGYSMALSVAESLWSVRQWETKYSRSTGRTRPGSLWSRLLPSCNSDVMIRRKRMRPLNSACLGRPHHISPPHGPLRFLQDNRIRTRPGPRLATGHLASSLVSSPTSHLNLGVRCLSYPPPPNSTLRRGRGGGLPEVHSQGSHGPGSQAAGQKSAYRAVCVVPPYLSRQGFYSWYFLVPKKDGGLCPILDLRVLNKHLRKYNFRMLTHGSRLRSIKKNEWFTSIDLKDAFFHISIYSPHRKCLRFAYQGMCYEFTVLPFDLSLSPRTFCLCMEAGSNPLRIAGLKILTYIADWLIIADSREKGMQNTARVLAHITALGFRVNVRKSNFTPAQNVNFQGLELNSITMRRTQERILSSVKCPFAVQGGCESTVSHVSQITESHGCRLSMSCL